MSFPVLHTFGELALLLDPSSGRLAASWGGGPLRWSAQRLPQPVRPVCTDADVGYLHQWACAPGADLPATLPGGDVQLWVVDGEEQPVCVTVSAGGAITLTFP